jgi:hypothetical protein
VLNLWGQLVPEMTNDVADELQLPMYVVEATWNRYFGSEAGFDPMVTMVEQAASAFSQWSFFQAPGVSYGSTPEYSAPSGEQLLRISFDPYTSKNIIQIM